MSTHVHQGEGVNIQIFEVEMGQPREDVQISKDKASVYRCIVHFFVYHLHCISNVIG